MDAGYKYIKIVSLKMVREGAVKYQPIINKNDCETICKSVLRDAHCETVILIGMDSGNRPNVVKTWEGTVNQCACYPQEVFKILLLANCASFILAHNHPGNNASPSGPDWALTGRMQDIGKMLDITMLDHLILTETRTVSLREFSRWDAKKES